MKSVLLKKLENREKPIDLILVGLGFMSYGFFSAVEYIRGLRVAVIISRRPQSAVDTLVDRGYKAQVIKSEKEIAGNLEKDSISVIDDLDIIKSYDNQVIVDMTGSVNYGTEIALKTLEAGKNLVTMNPELHVTVGTTLKKVFDEKGLVITDVLGDQPGCLARMIASAKLKGFKVRMAGNMKKYLDRYATTEKMQKWADDKGFYVKQTVSFTDGTKQSIEMTLVANYFGMDILQPDMVGPELESIEEAIEYFDWENISENGVVDYTLHLKNFPGVFLVVEHPDPHQQQYLSHLNVGTGPQYVLFEPVHLCHLEVAETIGKVIEFGEGTINNGLEPKLQTIACAKHDLEPGTKLYGIGGDHVYGSIRYINQSAEQLPIGLAKSAVIKKTVKKDQEIKLSDVILANTSATRLLNLV